MRAVVEYLNGTGRTVFKDDVRAYRKVLTISRKEEFPKSMIMIADEDRFILARLFNEKWQKHCENIKFGEVSVLAKCFSKAFVHKFENLEEAQQRRALISELEQKLRDATFKLQWEYGTIEEVSRVYGEWRKLTGVGYAWSEKILAMRIRERDEDRDGAEKEAIRNRIEKEWNAKMLSPTKSRTDIYHYWGIIKSSDDNFREYEEFTEEEMDEYYW